MLAFWVKAIVRDLAFEEDIIAENYGFMAASKNRR